MKNRMKKGGAIILAAAVLFSASVLPKVYAAREVVTSARCSVEISMAETGFSELEILPVKVSLYKVASIDAQGEYSAVDAFSEISYTDLTSDQTVAAEVWEKKTLKAKEIVEKNKVPATKTGEGQNGTILISDLDTGLYLVDAEVKPSASYQYKISPCLISLPNNNYYTSGNDDWIYNLINSVNGNFAINVKAEREDRFGDLKIVKTLDAFNETIGGATFVFQVEAYKTDVDTEEVKYVYSNVVSMTFDGPGTDSILIEDIPAGADVIVTEVYTGASYTLTSEAIQNTVILADGVEGAPATVDFANTYTTELNGGNGIVNSFLYNDETGEWTHSAAPDSTP